LCTTATQLQWKGGRRERAPFLPPLFLFVSTTWKEEGKRGLGFRSGLELPFSQGLSNNLLPKYQVVGVRQVKAVVLKRIEEKRRTRRGGGRKENGGWRRHPGLRISLEPCNGGVPRLNRGGRLRRG